MQIMLRILAVVALFAMTAAAQAQIAPLQVPSIIPPPPVPSAPPPPKIDVPQVPKMDAPQPQPKASQSRRSSFNDRVIGCLDDTYAAQLTSGERAAYSRGCANRAN